jgi:hypothetical protein
MAKVNTPGSGHGKFTSAGGNRYWPYTDAKVKKILEDAIFIIEHNVKKMDSCNKCFKKLPGGKTFEEIWNDDTVWINYEPRNRGWYGVTHGVGGKDISIAQIAFNKGRWWVAGTLVHELAHVDGAPATTTAADDTLLECGLKNAYEGVIGIKEPSSYDVGYA